MRSHQLLLAIESASSVYREKYRPWGWGFVVRHIGHGDGRNEVQTRLSIPYARGHGVSLKSGVVGHRSRHERQAEYKSTRLDPED